MLGDTRFRPSTRSFRAEGKLVIRLEQGQGFRGELSARPQHDKCGFGFPTRKSATYVSGGGGCHSDALVTGLDRLVSCHRASSGDGIFRSSCHPSWRRCSTCAGNPCLRPGLFHNTSFPLSRLPGWGCISRRICRLCARSRSTGAGTPSRPPAPFRNTSSPQPWSDGRTRRRLKPESKKT